MRDPARALKMPDGHWYVGAGSGFGGTGPNSNTNTGLPDSGTGCLAWFRSKDASLSSLEYVGCLLENNHTTGHIDPGTVVWSDKDMVAAFFGKLTSNQWRCCALRDHFNSRMLVATECPDVFPLGDKYLLRAIYVTHGPKTGTKKDLDDILIARSRYVAMASLYNWHAGGYFTNEWFLGTITDNKFKVEDRGLLDYGQY